MLAAGNPRWEVASGFWLLALASDFGFWLLLAKSREARQAGRANPEGAAHMDVRRFRRHRMCLTEIRDPLADPAVSSPGAP